MSIPFSVLPKRATAEMSKRGSQSSKGKLDDQTDNVSENEYYSSSQSEQTIQKGSQIELQKVVQSEKKKSGALPTDTGAKGAQVTVQNQEETDLSSEEPFLREELSDDEDTESLVTMDPSLLDPELDKNTPVFTLAKIFPRLTVKREDLDKDPEMNPDKVSKLTGITNAKTIEEYIQYYHDLCMHRRKIYYHARLIQRKLLDKDYEQADVESLLFLTENSKQMLDFIHTKCINMYDISAGQKRSYTAGMKNLTGAIVFLKEAVEAKHQAELEFQKEAKRKAEIEAEKAQSQIKALREVRDTRQTPHHSTPNRSGNDDPDKRSRPLSEPTGAGRNVTPRRNANTFFARTTRFDRGNGGSGQGGRNPDEGRRPPFVPDEEEEDERDPATAVIRQLTKALQKLQPNTPNKPDYRGIDKPKLDVFSGDASVYAHWKKKFLLLHGPERNLDDAYLANALHCLLKGEARRKVEVHFTADWNGDNYQRMWDTLDDHYGSKHIQDRCIQDRAARIIPLEQENLNTVSTFCDEITVQINYYLVHDPSAVNNDNSHLYQQIRRKMSDKIFLKFAEWTHGRDDEDEDSPPRSLFRLRKWLQIRTTLLRETEVFSSSAKHRTSKSPKQESFTSQTDLGDSSADESVRPDSEDEAEGCAYFINQSGRRVHFDKTKNKFYEQKPFRANRDQDRNRQRPDTRTMPYKQRFETSDGATQRFSSTPVSNACPVCRTVPHELALCEEFRKLPVIKRFAVVRQSGACFHCLNRGHPMTKCNVNKGILCNVDGCKRYEHPLIHADETTKRISYADWNDVIHGELIWDETESDVQRDVHFVNCTSKVMKLAQEGAIGIETAVCQLAGIGRRKQIRTCVMLDSGATHTYIDEDLASELNMRAMSAPFQSWTRSFHGDKLETMQRVEVNLTSHDGSLTIQLCAITKKNLTDQTGVVDWSRYKKNFDYLVDIPFVPLPKDPRIHLLIGGYHAFLFEKYDGTWRSGGPYKPIAYACPLGWVGFGPSKELPPDVFSEVDQFMIKQIPRK